MRFSGSRRIFFFLLLVYGREVAWRLCVRLAYYGKANWFLILGDCCGHTMLEDKLVFDIMVAKPYGLLCLKGFFFSFFLSAWVIMYEA